MIIAKQGISDMTTLEEDTMYGVVTNSKEERKATFLLYNDRINKYQNIPASNIKEIIINLAEKTEIPKTE